MGIIQNGNFQLISVFFMHSYNSLNHLLKKKKESQYNSENDY